MNLEHVVRKGTIVVNDVLAIAAVEYIGVRTAITLQKVVALPTDDVVIAEPADEGVVAGETLDFICFRRPRQDIIELCSRDQRCCGQDIGTA